MPDLKTAEPHELVEYLLVNPVPTAEETGEMLLNICHRLHVLVSQNKKQDTAINESRESLGQLWRQKQKSKQYTVKRRVTSQKAKPNDGQS